MTATADRNSLPQRQACNSLTERAGTEISRPLALMQWIRSNKLIHILFVASVLCAAPPDLLIETLHLRLFIGTLAENFRPKSTWHVPLANPSTDAAVNKAEGSVAKQFVYGRNCERSYAMHDQRVFLNRTSRDVCFRLVRLGSAISMNNRSLSTVGIFATAGIALLMFLLPQPDALQPGLFGSAGNAIDALPPSGAG